MNTKCIDKAITLLSLHRVVPSVRRVPAGARQQDLQQPGRGGEGGGRRPVPLQDLILHFLSDARFLQVSACKNVQYSYSCR